ncbi:gamma carbonic anhydrase family protein [Porticoccus sp.]|uniref:gamma carbonic anhydrase family protein n=1 Tax=Porticoccus sp. TaxID=2024853 RepID=UPI0039E5B801
MTENIRPYKGVLPTLGERVYIDPAATVIGNVTLGDDVSVWPGAVVRGDMHRITVGNRSNIQDTAVLHITHASDFNPGGWPLTIGDNVIVGHGAILHGCTLGDYILVGNGAIINDGAVVENEVIIGAGTVVPPGKHLESGNLYVGNPCRLLRPVSDEERAFFSYSPGNYVKLKDQYLTEQADDWRNDAE